jgi:hypothetical protein
LTLFSHARSFRMVPAVLKNDEPEGFTAEELALFDKLNLGKEGGIPLPSFIKPSEVAAQARPLAGQVFEQYELLKQVTDGQFGRLYEIWKSMKKSARKQLLEASWNDVPQHCRPDLASWRRHESDKTPGWTDQEREGFMWPHVNVEELAKARPLLLLLHSRSNNAPGVFAEADLDSTKLGKSCLALMPKYLNKYSMFFTQQDNAETYGRLVSWEDIEAQGLVGLDNQGTHPGEGLWVLTIQARLYAFLVDVARRILAQREAAAHDIVNGLKEGFGIPDSDFVDLPTTISEAPYAAPAPTDLQRVLNFAYSMVWKAEDHFWALRDDPSYFKNSMQDWREHSRDMILGEDDQPHPSARNPAYIWSAAINRCIKSAIEEIETWNIIYAKAHLVAQQLEKHSASLTSNAPLPRDLALSIYSLYQHLKNIEGAPITALQTGALASPSLRQYFRLAPAEGQDDGTISLSPSSTPRSQEADDLIWTLTKLQDPEQRRLIGPIGLFAQLDHQLQASQAARTLVTPWTASQLSTSALTTLCLAELDSFRPWATHFASAMQEKQTAEILAMDWAMTMQRLRPIVEYDLPESVTALAVPDDGKFDGPPELAKKALDAFWDKLRHGLERNKALTVRVREIFTALPARRSKFGAGASSKRAASPPRTKVDRRALKVFRALFHDPAAAPGQTPAEVGWLDVVHAVRGAGLEVTRLYVSAWLFVPKNQQAAGQGGGAKEAKVLPPSLFEEPRGRGKMSAEEARWIGRRLNRAYGWGLENFEGL